MNTDRMPSVLITGAHQGLGLALAAHHADMGWEVIAANPRPLRPRDMVALGPGLREFPCDPSDDASMAAMVGRLGARPLDLVILAHQVDPGPDLPPEEIAPALWDEAFLVNTWAPLHLAALLEPNLRAGRMRKLVAVTGPAPGQGRRFAHRASTAALNQVMRNLSIDWRSWGAVVLMVLGQGAAESPQAAALRIGAVIDTAASGRLWAAPGQECPW